MSDNLLLAEAVAHLRGALAGSGAATHDAERWLHMFDQRHVGPILPCPLCFGSREIHAQPDFTRDNLRAQIANVPEFGLQALETALRAYHAVAAENEALRAALAKTRGEENDD